MFLTSIACFSIHRKQICNYNRHFAEMGGYFLFTPFEKTVLQANGPITFYDSVTGKPLFVAPIHRSAEDFIQVGQKKYWLCCWSTAATKLRNGEYFFIENGYNI